MFNESIEVTCPACSPESKILHYIIKQNTVKCRECGSVHIASFRPPAKTKPILLRAVVSFGALSKVCKTEMFPKEKIGIGQELIIDDELSEEVYLIEVTSIESKGKRVNSAIAKDIDTIWGRVIDEVEVKVAIHSGKKTKSINLRVHGDYDFVVGNIETFKGNSFKIKKIKVRNGGFKEKIGNRVKAKNIKRIYAVSLRKVQKYRGVKV
ncbi:MAG: HVO_0476 family zinc finger protein [Methanosarcinales archaeon]